LQSLFFNEKTIKVSKKKREFTLIGFPLSHSFSQKYFSEKFAKEQLFNHEYFLSPMEKVEDLQKLIAGHPNLAGINVTIPHKEKVLPYLDEVSQEAEIIGAVNTIKIKE
jgi:shikimate dehydrogenase